MEHVIEVEGLTKSYRRKKVVDNVSFDMKKGHIYGLIGPNGAGKTTIMRMLAGLTQANAGTMSFFESEGDLDHSRERMSFMIESPYLEKTMTAKQNLTYLRYARGVADEARVNQMLEKVGLADVGKKKVGKFSLGMRQRLGIGMALLSGPEVMVLDEPVNGLDPEGIVEVRHLLKRLAEEDNITILISSHILSELSELCTDYIIINNGKILEELTKEELDEKCMRCLAIKTTNMAETVATLEKEMGMTNYKVVHDDELRIYEFLDQLEEVSRTITGHGEVILKFNTEGESLENYYLSKVGGQNV